MVIVTKTLAKKAREILVLTIKEIFVLNVRRKSVRGYMCQANGLFFLSY